MSTLDYKLERIGKKLETTKMPKGDFPYKFGTSIPNKILYTLLYVPFAYGIYYITFINKISIYEEKLGEYGEYYVHIQTAFLMLITIVYLIQFFKRIKISRTEIVYPIFYDFFKKKVAIQDIEQISFFETLTIPRAISLVAVIFPRAFSAIEARVYANGKLHTFNLTGKELKIVRVLQEVKPDEINTFFYDSEENEFESAQ